MEKMTVAMMKQAAKDAVLEMLAAKLEECGAERYDSKYHVAVPVTINDQEIWVKVDLTAAQWTKSKVADAFNPFELRQEYDLEQAAKSKAAAEKAEAKKAAAAKAKSAE